MKDKISLAFLLAVSLYTVSAQSIKLKPNNDYKEVWHKNIPISGGLKVGMMYSVSAISKVQKSFFVRLPEGKYNNKLCVKVNSRDGRLFASMSYDLKLKQGGLIELEWPTKYWEDLKNYTTDKVVILALLNKECNEEEEIIVPASWNKNDISDKITFVVNSDKSPKVEVFNKKSKKAKQYQCSLIAENDKVAFKCLCEVPLSEITKDCEINIFHKVRSGPTYSFKSFPVVLKL